MPDSVNGQVAVMDDRLRDELRYHGRMDASQWIRVVCRYNDEQEKEVGGDGEAEAALDGVRFQKQHFAPALGMTRHWI